VQFSGAAIATAATFTANAIEKWEPTADTASDTWTGVDAVSDTWTDGVPASDTWSEAA